MFSVDKQLPSAEVDITKRVGVDMVFWTISIRVGAVVRHINFTPVQIHKSPQTRFVTLRPPLHALVVVVVIDDDDDDSGVLVHLRPTYVSM